MPRTADGAAEIADTRKEDKFAVLSINYDLILIVLETLGPLSTTTSAFLRELDRRLINAAKDPRETAFLF